MKKKQREWWLAFRSNWECHPFKDKKRAVECMNTWVPPYVGQEVVHVREVREVKRKGKT